MTLQEELTVILNKHCAENRSRTPDYLLAEYLLSCFHAYEKAVIDRDHWHDDSVPITFKERSWKL